MEGTVTSITVGATAFDITVVVLSIWVSVSSLTTTVKVVVSEVAVLLSVGLKDKALNFACKSAGVVLAIV